MVRNLLRALTGVALAAMVSGCGSALETLNAVTPDSGHVRTADIAYGDSPRQQLDIYRPKQAAQNPQTVLFVYGGAWRDGTREEYEFVAGALAGAGHTVIVPDYRLYPEVRWPRFAEDIVAALQHVSGDATELLGEPLRSIVLMGHSSGAHTAAVIAASAGRWLPDDAPAIAGLIGLSGPYDLPLENPEVAPVFGSVTDSDSVKPPALVDATHPPTLLLHGTDDERVLPFHTERYAAALGEAAVDVSVHRLDGAGHASTIAAFAAPLDLLNDAPELTIAWLDGLSPRPGP